MRSGRGWRAALAVSLTVAVAAGCSRRKAAEINPIEPTIAFNRAKVPLGSAVEITYTWKLAPNAKKLSQDYRALVHFLDAQKQQLFEDDHPPVPPVTQWEPGKTYTYTRTKFVPVYQYVGPVEVRMGLYTTGGRSERVALQGQDAGMNEIMVGRVELVPQTDNIFLVEKEGWYGPEPSPQNPGLDRIWTKREAVLSFKNPRKDVVFYLEADTNAKAFAQPPALTVWVPSKAPAPAPTAAKGKPAAPAAPAGIGLLVPIENSEVFLKKIRFKAADLGDGDWVDLKLSMNQSFVPKTLGVNNDERELGLMVYHTHVAPADEVGQVPNVVEAGPVAPPPAPVAAAPAPAGAPAKAGTPVKKP